MIEVAPGIFYDPTKTFAEQSDEFKEYANNKYYEALAAQINTSGYPDFNPDGSFTFIVEDALLRAEVTRVQVIPFSTSDRRIKETIINITVK